ncbi:glycosyltransferase [Burkholderia cenocepacia]|uniref:glycosyltransferase n=1 Tax=Burkholderia cenocepacia TaxID=95486 RepID=UPI001B94B0BE|nr:glycosyltransferase [Burkholderia cenocepacia]MBR8377280.1 glycosyltransferase [Burkholderia cenocepacia]
MKVLIDGQTLGTPEISRGIGQVFLRIVEGMVTHEIGIKWFIAIRDISWLNHFSPQVRDALCPIVLPPLEASGPQAEWCRAYGNQLQRLHAKHNFDVYWNVNPLMINVHYPFGLRDVRIVCTLHDLIPAVFPEKYYGEWRDELVDDYKLRLEEIAAHAHTVMCVSSHSAKDFRRLLPEAKARAVVGTLASDFTRMWPSTVGPRMSNPPYVLYVGGFDPRKNMTGAVRTFAKFYSGLPRDSQRPILRLVCAHTDEQRAQMIAEARELGIADAIDLTGYVSDDYLGQLFREASLFFFPTLYEGFGLPVLDALACGIPVVASNNSSIPEVCSGYGYLFDVDDDDDVVEKLSTAWRDRVARPGPWMENAVHAREFHWTKTCNAYLALFHSMREGAMSSGAARRIKLAYLSPWPPQKNGIADYSFALVQELAKLADVTVFTPAENPLPLAGVSVQPIDMYRTRSGEYDRAIYHIGNGLDHCEIYRCAWDIPGVVVIHDYNVHPFTQHGYLFKGERAFYRTILTWYGERGEAAWAEVEGGGYADIWEFPMTEPLVARSTAAVVHSRWVAERLANDATPILVSHHGTHPKPMVADEDRATALKQLKLAQSEFYVGVFGFINKNKRVDVTMRAVAQLRGEGYPVSLLLVGEANDSEIDLRGWAREFELSDAAWHHTSFVSQDDFLRYMCASDVIVNLRYPTMGESSGSLFNSFALGKACIVSNLAQFAELPHSVAWKCDLDEFEVPQLVEYLRFMFENPDARNQLALNAHRFARDFASFEESARRYVEAASLR